jgi:hypothetical protein
MAIAIVRHCRPSESGRNILAQRVVHFAFHHKR